MIYTSGSTGQPKGVEIEHRSVVNFLTSMQRSPGITSADRFVSVTTLSFDIAGLEIFGRSTMVGARDRRRRSGDALDGAQLGNLLERSGATILQATPATWRMLIDAGWTRPTGLKALCGGEALPRDLAAGAWRGRRRAVEHVRADGDDDLVDACAGVADLRAAITIGRPIANTRVYVFEPSGVLGADRRGRASCASAGRASRAAIANRPELTAERFVTDAAVRTARRERVYRTGDMARFRATDSSSSSAGATTR